AVERLAGGAVPRHHRLALIRYADAGEPRRLLARVLQRLARDAQRHVPDLVRVVLDPAGAREVLLELRVGTARDPALPVEDDAGRARGALVDREDHRREM